MRKILPVLLLVLTAMSAKAADYYWVGGGGQWSDLNHWRLGSSTGTIPSIVPSSADNIFFTNQSGFTAGSRTVVLDANGFCNNMSWNAVPNSPSFNAANASFSLQISGDVSLSPTTTYNIILAFKGTSPATLTANGNVLGELGLEIDKPGSSLTLTDNLIVPATTTVFGTAGATFTSGTFDISDKNVTIYNFIGDNANVRTLQMTNANLTTHSSFRYVGLNKTLNAAGSFIQVFGITTDGGTYNKATVTSAGGPNTNIVSGSTFSSLTFTSTTQIYSDIANNNIVDTLVFMGQGYIGNSNVVGRAVFNGLGGVGINNTITSLQCNGTASITGGNTIGKLTAQNNLQITGVNTVDSLLLAANRTTTIAGTININMHMRAQGLPCEAFTEIVATSLATLNFGPAATALIDNVNLTNIGAQGSITPITVSGVDGEGNLGFNIVPPASLSGTNLYWVGGAGDWNDNSHWSYTSGGPGGACIPFIADTVIFNSASGLGSGRIVTTSGNSYCYDMKWLTGVGTTTFNESGSAALNIYGSLVLTPAVTMNAIAEFPGESTSSTITVNGSSSGSLRFYIRKKAAGAVTLLDNWTNANGFITLGSGVFNMPGRTVSINNFNSAVTNARSLDISNANITVNTWNYTGANKTINSAGSYLNIGYATSMDGLSYPRVDNVYAGAGNPQVFLIQNTTIGALTFTGTNPTSGVNIDGNNTIRRLEFRGAGAIEAGGNVIDSLILAASRNYLITGNSTINQYFSAESPACTGLLEIRGATTGTFTFAPTAVIAMANVYLQNMTAAGVPPVAFNGADAGGNSGWNISSAAGTPRYWVGGSGDWNDNSHWSTTSGGTGGACIPTVYDDVYFNAASGFTAVSKTVTVNNGNAYCRNLDWSAAGNSPIWSKATAWNIEVWGETVQLNAAATFNVSPLTFKGNNTTVLSGTALGNFDIRLSKPGGTLQFANDYSNILTDIYVNDGALNVAGRTVSLSSINNEGLSNTMSIDISGANVTLDTLWRYNGAAGAHTLTAGSSVINTETFLATGMTYDKVNVSGITNTEATFSNATINELTFTDANTASRVGINGTSNVIDKVEYKGSGGIYGTGNTIHTLIFFPGNTYTLNNGTNTTITGEWYGSGTPCRLTEIVSSSTTANATITKTAGNVSFDYVRLRRITAAGPAQPFVAGEHSINLGGNSNWNIAPYNGAAPIYGLGPDLTLSASAFPYTLGTDGFFGVPSSQYTWNDNSTGDTLVITDTGYYSVTVNFVDGCTISDTIHVTLAVTLPVSLNGFDVQLQNCEAYLRWNVADATNFREFVVERSDDGRQFTTLTTINYDAATASYQYIDKGVPEGLSFYRLKLIDLDGRFDYSNVIQARTQCNRGGITVYPTITKGLVWVNLPETYRETRIEVYTSLGQLMKSPNTVNEGNTGLHKLQLSGLTQGYYFIKISYKGGAQTFKVFYQP